MRCTTRWLVGPTHDLAMVLAWVPFAVAVWGVDGDPGRSSALVGAVLAFSFAHQPLTLGLVYGDPAERARHRALYAWSPGVLAFAVLAGLAISATAVALVAGVWNAAHTLRQRYGIARLYGRMAGHDDGRAENVMLWWWLAAAVAIAITTSDIAAAIDRSGLGTRNRVALDRLDSLGDVLPGLATAVLVIAGIVTIRWLLVEVTHPVVNRAKWAYLGSTGALLMVLAIHPIAGFVGYIGAHAVEYFLVVRRRLATTPGEAGPLRAVVMAAGPTATLLGYGAAVALVPVALHVSTTTYVANVAVLVLGGLHLLHDGFVWRRPRAVAPRTPSPHVSTLSKEPT